MESQWKRMLHGVFDMGTPLFINKLAFSPLTILRLSVPITRKGQGLLGS